MDEETCGATPANPHAGSDIPLMAKPSPTHSSSLVLIHLQHLGKRWQRLRDRVIASPPAMRVERVGETWSADEAFAEFLLDRLERDLESSEGEGSSYSDAVPSAPQLEPESESRYSVDNAVRRTPRRQNPILRLRPDVESDQPSKVDKRRKLSNPSIVEPGHLGNGLESAGNEDKTTDEAFWSETGPGQEETENVAVPASTCHTTAEQLGEVDEEPLPEGQHHSSSPGCEMETGNRNESGAAGVSTGDLEQLQEALAKQEESPQGVEGPSGERAPARQEEAGAKVKRKRGRPRIETDDAERKAVMFNRRLKAISHQEDLPRVFSCRSCGEQFQESGDLRMHTITAHLPISIPESGEGAIMEGSSEMMQFTHIEIDLGLYQQVNEVDIRELSVELRRCPECQEYVEDMRAHLEIHMMKNYICEECGKGFASRKELLPHAAHHRIDRAGGKPYSCTFCGKAFRTPQSLSIHRPLHNKARNFMCQQCGKTFKANTRLQKHLGTHAQHKRYSCPACGRGFAQKCNMTRHQRTHTGERPYACRHCEQRFNHNVSLKRHLKKEHSVEVEERTRRTVEGIDNFSAIRQASKRAKKK